MDSVPRSAREAEIFAGLKDRPDDDLIGIVAEGPAAVFPGADDDVDITAAACIILQRRLDGEGGGA
jgi:hypothetical protein